jgi:hypothetical protein
MYARCTRCMHDVHSYANLFRANLFPANYNGLRSGYNEILDTYENLLLLVEIAAAVLPTGTVQLSFFKSPLACHENGPSGQSRDHPPPSTFQTGYAKVL